MTDRLEPDPRDGGMPAVRQVFDALDRNGVAWALLRPLSSLDADGDVDVLVDPSSLVGARAAALAAGFVDVPGGWPGDVVLVAHERSSRRAVWLHLQPVLRIGLQAVAADELLARRRRCDGVAVLADGDLLATLLLHGVVDLAGVRDRYRTEVCRLASDQVDDVAWAENVAALHGLDHAALVRSAARADWRSLDVVAAGVTVRPPVPDKVRGRVERWRRRRRMRGIAVAVVGPDGAGKTSLVDRLASDLPVPTATMYMGLTGGRMPAIDRWRVPGVMLAARLTLLWLRWAVVSRDRWRGLVVVLDRAPIDGLVPPGRPVRASGRWSRRIQAGLGPRPDLTIVLDAPGDLLHRRSGEYDPETLEAWRQRYRSLADGRARTYVLDASADPDVVADRAVQLVWSSLSGRWGGVMRPDEITRASPGRSPRP